MTLMFEISGYEGFRGLAADRLATHEFYRDLTKAIEKHELPIQLPYGPQRSGTPFLIALPGQGRGGGAGDARLPGQRHRCAAGDPGHGGGAAPSPRGLPARHAKDSRP